MCHALGVMVSLLVGAVSFVSAGEARLGGHLSFTAYCQAELVWYDENGQIQDRVPWSVVVHVDGPYWEILPRYAGPKELMAQHHEAYSFFMSEEGFARISRIKSKNGSQITTAVIGDEAKFTGPRLPVAVAWSALAPKADELTRELKTFRGALSGEFSSTFLDPYATLLVQPTNPETVDAIEFAVEYRQYDPDVHGLQMVVTNDISKILASHLSKSPSSQLVSVCRIVDWSEMQGTRYPKELRYTRYWVNSDDSRKAGSYATTIPLALQQA